MTKESGRSTYKIYVGNLAPHTTDNDLFQVFGSYGTVVEAIALSGKGFGFVHMGSEDEGVRAMKSLYKYSLNGKEMVVQPAINPKKASVNQYSTRRATIGKGVSTLDDFDDYNEYHSDSKYLEQDINSYLAESDSPPPVSDTQSSPPTSYSSYSSSVGSCPVSTQLSINNVVSNNCRPSNGHAQVAVTNSVATTPSRGTNLENCTNARSALVTSASSCGNINGVSKKASNGYPLPLIQQSSNGSVVNSSSSIDNAINSLGTSQARSNSIPQIWNFPSNSGVVASNSNQINNTLAQNSSQSNNNNGSALHVLNDNNIGANSLFPATDTLFNSQLRSQINNVFANQVNNVPVGQNVAFGGFAQGQLNQLQLALQQNPNNPQLIAAANKVQQQLLSQPPLHLSQQDLQLLAQQHQNQLQLQHQLSSVNNSTFPSRLVGNAVASNNIIANGLTHGNVSINSATPTIQSNLGNNTYNMNNLGNGAVSNTSDMNKHSSYKSASNNPATSPANVCGVCNEVYNGQNRLPKILGCTHTFCLRCLHSIASSNGRLEVTCPSGCGVSTQLSEAGVVGLTTNQGIYAAVAALSHCNGDSLIDSSAASSNQLTNHSGDLCVTCTVAGTASNQSMSSCREQDHHVVRTQVAVNAMLSQMEPAVNNCLTMVKQTMTLRAVIKTRVESTIQSLAKFMEELKRKIERDDEQEDVLMGTLQDLTRVQHNLRSQSYAELLKSYNMMKRFDADISYQYNQVVTAACVNDAVKSMAIQMHSNRVVDLAKIGLNASEVFRMDQSLQDHARVGNYANVLLQYMVSDLLVSRLSHNVNRGMDGMRGAGTGRDFGSSANTDSNDNLSSLQDRSAASSVSPGILAGDGVTSNGVFHSLSASSSVTPDMNAMAANMNRHEAMVNNLDNMDINCVIETTAAIEAENLGSDLTCFSDNATSLGLSNICTMVDTEDSLDTLDLEKSLLEGSACIDSTVAIPSSAPSPRGSSTSITPPIVTNAARSSVDSSAASSDSGIGCKPFSYLDAAKKPAKPQPEPQPKPEVVKVPAQVKQIKTPHCWMKVAVDGNSIGRIVFQLRPDKAPRMCENFLGLCVGKPGYGYQGSHFFKNGDGFLAGGDVEFDDGTGGYSIFGKKKFEADLCPLKDEVGMIRFKGNGTSEAGRGMVGSQFMVWYAEREFKKFSYSLVFGRVVDGLDVVKKAANVNLSKHDVMIEESGGIM